MMVLKINVNKLKHSKRHPDIIQFEFTPSGLVVETYYHRDSDKSVTIGEFLARIKIEYINFISRNRNKNSKSNTIKNMKEAIVFVDYVLKNPPIHNIFSGGLKIVDYTIDTKGEQLIFANYQSSWQVSEIKIMKSVGGT